MSIARHTTYNIVGAIVPIAVSLVTVPLYLTVIGLDRYGVLSICWLLLGYFNIFDLGLGRATAQKIATLAHSDPSERSRAFWTGAGFSLALVMLALLVFVPISAVALGTMNLPSSALRLEVSES